MASNFNRQAAAAAIALAITKARTDSGSAKLDTAGALVGAINEIFSQVDAALEQRDKRLRDQASRIAALERQLGGGQ